MHDHRIQKCCDWPQGNAEYTHALSRGQIMCMETAVYHGAELHLVMIEGTLMEWPLKTCVWASALHGH